MTLKDDDPRDAVFYNCMSSTIVGQRLKVIKYDPVKNTLTVCYLGVDQYGFTIYWASIDGKTTTKTVDVATIRDTRRGYGNLKQPWSEKTISDLLVSQGVIKPADLEKANLHDLSFVLLYTNGGRYTDFRFVTFVCSSSSEASYWRGELFRLSRLPIVRSPGFYHSCLKAYSRILLTTRFPVSLKQVENFLLPGKKRRVVSIFNEKFESAQELTLQKFIELIFRMTKRDHILRHGKILIPACEIENIVQKVNPLKLEETQRQELFLGLLNAELQQETRDAFLKHHQEHDMTQPLSHYFINSSHNTYLQGAQIAGTSSVEMYRQVLLDGCRCVELDLWETDDGRPIVTHGKTFTSSIDLEETLAAIAEYAFKVTPYPLILSLENHCSQPVQRKVADLIRKAFGAALLERPLAEYPLEPGRPLPSPAALMNRVLVKHKPTPQKIASDRQASTNSEEWTDCEGELHGLVNYVKPTKLVSFERAAELNRAYECVSLVEGRALELARSEEWEFLRFNERQLSRIYPFGGRVKSTNFVPYNFWRVGCQMVALNFQNRERGMVLNNECFARNNSTGYLLKPYWMRDPTADRSILRLELRVRVISAILLSRERCRTVVTVKTFSLLSNKSPTYTAGSVTSDGLSTIYHQKQLFTFCIASGHMSVIRLNVKEERSNKSLGCATLPTEFIKPGCQRLVLKNGLGQALPGSLLVHFEVREAEVDRHNNSQQR